MSQSLTLSASAKINLWLEILGRRDDGYHEVETRLLRTDVADQIRVDFDPSGDEVTLSCSDPSVPIGEENLATQALRAFQRAASMGGRWHLDLTKKIPAGAGLGGGSSNAAAVLRAANQLCGNPLSPQALTELAAALGVDVAFFALDVAAADGTGRGEQVVAIKVPEVLSVVLIKPPFGVSTPWAYGRWKESRELPGILYAPQITSCGALVNHLERPVFEKHRFLAALKMWLLRQQECLAALMSGSGSTLFALTRSANDGLELAERARGYCGETFWIEVARAGV